MMLTLSSIKGVPLIASLNDSIFPPLPANEPHRIATITLYYQSVTRSLVYLLRWVTSGSHDYTLDHMIHSFRLSAGPVSIPLQLLMLVVCQPFTMFPDRLVGEMFCAVYVIYCLGWQTCPGGVAVEVCPANILLYYVCIA